MVFGTRGARDGGSKGKNVETCVKVPPASKAFTKHLFPSTDIIVLLVVFEKLF